MCVTTNNDCHHLPVSYLAWPRLNAAPLILILQTIIPNLNQPRFLVLPSHCYPYTVWWCAISFGVVATLHGIADFKTTRLGSGGIGGKLISTKDDEGYEDSIYFQHQPMQPTLQQQQHQLQHQQSFGRNGSGRKESGHIYNNQ